MNLPCTHTYMQIFIISSHTGTIQIKKEKEKKNKHQQQQQTNKQIKNSIYFTLG